MGQALCGVVPTSDKARGQTRESTLLALGIGRRRLPRQQLKLLPRNDRVGAYCRRHFHSLFHVNLKILKLSPVIPRNLRQSRK